MPLSQPPTGFVVQSGIPNRIQTGWVREQSRLPDDGLLIYLAKERLVGGGSIFTISRLIFNNECGNKIYAITAIKSFSHFTEVLRGCMAYLFHMITHCLRIGISQFSQTDCGAFTYIIKIMTQLHYRFSRFKNALYPISWFDRANYKGKKKRFLLIKIELP